MPRLKDKQTTTRSGQAPRSARARMLLATSRLLQTQGYHGTGLKQVLDEAAAPRGSLYFHFPGGKDQLAIEALAGSQAWVTRFLEGTLAQAGDVRHGVRAIFAAFVEQLRQSDFAQGCPFATVALESAKLNDPVRAACGEAFATWQALLAERLRPWEPDPTRAAGLAALILAGIEGGLVLAKAQRSTAPLEAIAAEIDALLAARQR